MAKKSDGDTAVAEPREVLFAELEDSPEHKALLKAAKAFHKAKADRDALLSTSKEKVDGLQAALIAQMHQCNMTKFKHDNVKVELIQTKEKVEVDLEEEDEGAD